MISLKNNIENRKECLVVQNMMIKCQKNYESDHLKDIVDLVQHLQDTQVEKKMDNKLYKHLLIVAWTVADRPTYLVLGQLQ